MEASQARCVSVPHCVQFLSVTVYRTRALACCPCWLLWAMGSRTENSPRSTNQLTAKAVGVMRISRTTTPEEYISNPRGRARRGPCILVLKRLFCQASGSEFSTSSANDVLRYPLAGAIPERYLRPTSGQELRALRKAEGGLAAGNLNLAFVQPYRLPPCACQLLPL